MRTTQSRKTQKMLRQKKQQNKFTSSIFLKDALLLNTDFKNKLNFK